MFCPRLIRRAACLLSALSPLMVLSSPGAAQTPPTAARPQRLDYKVAALPNGLKIVTLEDHRAPVVTLQVWYRVGSKDEPKGKHGFAHLFEHLMFKGSKNVAPQGHSRAVEQIGGDYNANTSFDRTLYYETVPSNALDRVLWLEADRMASLRVDAANLKSERSVVEEEYRLRVANAPYGTLLEKVQGEVYPAAHPYSHSTIGSIPDLDSAALSDVKAFHDQYYKPGDATLVLVGDFQTADALAKIRKYFGPIAAAVKPFARIPVPEAAPTAARRATVYDPLAPLPLIAIAYRLPPPDSPDTPAFDVVSGILSSGQSSRLYRSLVRDKQLAVQAFGEDLTLKLGGLFFFAAVSNAGKAPADVENALGEEISKLIAEPVSAEELEKAKNQALTAQVFGRLSTEQKASALGEADLLYGTPEEANKDYDKLTAVTAADVQRVAKQYFAPEKRSVLYMLPAAMKPKEATK